MTARWPLVALCGLPALMAVLVAPDMRDASRADEPSAAEVSSPLGRAIDGFALGDHRGHIHRLADYADSSLVVVAFLGTECPLARLYAPRLVELADEYAPRGVQFIGIDSNQQDTLEKIAAFARRNELNFPLLKDPGNQVANLLGAARTPEVFVLDAARVVRYHGRIDDQYGYSTGVGYQRPEPTRRDLVAALDELLAGAAVSVPTTAAAGCHIGRVKAPRADSEVTYSNQIARIFQARCVECHRTGQIAPFALETYDDAVGWGEMIREVVETQRMPPWHADPRWGRFSNEARLSDEEQQLIAAWVEAGCPEGDRAELPPPREFVEGWSIGEPDLLYHMSDAPYEVPAEGVVEYQYFVVDPGFKEDTWVAAAEARPGAIDVVHHIIVFIIPPGQKLGPDGRPTIFPTDLLGGYAPGLPAMQGYRGMARKVAAGSRLLFQMHYTPNGRAQQDRSYLGLKLADPSQIRHDVRSGLVANLAFAIPPGESDYEVTAQRRFRSDTLLLWMMPHMHLRGKSFLYEVEYPDGSREVLLSVPRYDFNWQLAYVLEEPKLLPAGTVLTCTARFDNSAENLSNPDPTQTVRWGDQTWEEMMIGWYVWTDAKPRRPGVAGRAGSDRAGGGE